MPAAHRGLGVHVEVQDGVQAEAGLLHQVGCSRTVQDGDGGVGDEPLFTVEARREVGRQVEGERELVQASREELLLVL